MTDRLFPALTDEMRRERREPVVGRGGVTVVRGTRFPALTETKRQVEATPPPTSLVSKIN